MVAAIPGRVSTKRCLDPFEKSEVVRRGSGRSTERQIGLYHTLILRDPLVGRATGHGPTCDQCDLVNADVIADQPMLGSNVFPHLDLRKLGSALWRGCVGRGRRPPVPEVDPPASGSVSKPLRGAVSSRSECRSGANIASCDLSFSRHRGLRDYCMPPIQRQETRNLSIPLHVT